MGRLFECAILLSSFAFILGVQHSTDASIFSQTVRNLQNNFTSPRTNHNLLSEQNDTSNRRISNEIVPYSRWQSSPPPKTNTRQSYIQKRPGLSHFYSGSPNRSKQRNYPPVYQRNAYHRPPQNNFINTSKRNSGPHYPQKIFTNRPYGRPSAFFPNNRPLKIIHSKDRTPKFFESSNTFGHQNNNAFNRDKNLFNQQKNYAFNYQNNNGLNYQNHNTISPQNNKAEGSQKFWSYLAHREAGHNIKLQQLQHQQQQYHQQHQHRQFSAPICNSCNSVPWIPLIKVPNSYRQEKTQHYGGHGSQITAHSHVVPQASASTTHSHLNPQNIQINSHPTPVPSQTLHSYGFKDFKSGSTLNDNQDFRFPPLTTQDSQILSSNTEDFLVPPIPILQSAPNILDGTISSSYGLPVGNIPLGHGLLAPLNHLATKFNRYGANSIDYSNVLTYFTPPSFIGTGALPALSSVPVVPVYDPSQFYSNQILNPPVSSLVPPTSSSVTVSNVFFTISEGNSKHRGHTKEKLNNLDTVKSQTNVDLTLNHQSNSEVNPHTPLPLAEEHHQNNNQQNNLNSLDVVKSVPVGEFTVNQNQPLYSNIQNHLTSDSTGSNHQNGGQVQSAPTLNNIPPEYESFPPYFDVNTNSSKSDESSYLTPPLPPQPQYQESFNSELSVPKPLTGPSASWLFLDAPTEPNVLANTPNPLTAESHEIASVVNSELRPVSPVPYSINQNIDSSGTKKIQYIIPYITKERNEVDQSGFGSVQHEIFHSLPNQTNFESNNVQNLTYVTTPVLEKDLISEVGSLEEGWSNIQTHNQEQNESRKAAAEEHTENNTNSSQKIFGEVQHIIAKNIKELLNREIERVPVNQNFPLQKNIDNWTAFEYSNHKTVETKAPKEIISQAQAVTSIPGTSISHLLLPSKKIPNEYFQATPPPVYEDAPNFLYTVTNSTVYSRPFTTKPYASANLYHPSTTSSQFGSTPSPFGKKGNKNHSNEEFYDTGYTVFDSKKINNWEKLNENLVDSEAGETSDSQISFTNNNKLKLGSSRKEKVDIVTPVAVITKDELVYQRTTRQVHEIEKKESSVPGIQTTTPISPTFFKTSSNKSVSVTVSNRTVIKTIKSTKLSKVSNSPNIYRKVNSSGGNRTKNSSAIARLKVVDLEKAKNFNKTAEGNSSTSNVYPVFPSTFLRNVSSEDVFNLYKTGKSEEGSINDIIPFRNKELPWEPAKNASDQNSGRTRKSLIRQTRLRRPRSQSTVSTKTPVTDSESGTVSVTQY